MASQISTTYPFIAGVSGERGGHLDNPTVDSALFTTPTATFTQFSTGASVGIGFIPGGHLKIKFNETVYRIPVYTNA